MQIDAQATPETHAISVNIMQPLFLEARKLEWDRPDIEFGLIVRFVASTHTFYFRIMLGKADTGILPVIESLSSDVYAETNLSVAQYRSTRDPSALLESVAADLMYHFYNAYLALGDTK